MTSKRILLFGKTGQLGSHLFRLLQNEDLVAADFPEVDFNDHEEVADLIDAVQPALIINAVAYTNVDGAESDTGTAMQVNGHTVGLIAKKAKQLRAGFIHYSTDYVFDGEKGDPYTEEDQPNPINVYGKSKLLGEEETIFANGSYLIFRLSWVYTVDKPSFVTKVLQWGRQHETVRIVDDQISSPTWAYDAADLTARLIRSLPTPWYESINGVKGLYHLAGTGAVSRFEWGKTILELDPNRAEQICETVLPAKSDEFPTPARRPLYSALNCAKLQHKFNLIIPPWRESLIAAMEELPRP